jgi:RHS repeat-associated protein
VLTGGRDPIRVLAGQYWDAESNLTYNGARYYSSALGRFLTPDPKSVLEHAEDFIDSIRAGSPQPADFNPFVYAGNNPLRFTDPTGLDYWMEGAVEGEAGLGRHQSVCVGKWNGVRKCISFGRKPSEGNCLFDCKGHVYYDRSAAGPVVDERYRYTDGATDRRISTYFDSLVGGQGTWDLFGGKNCRVFSEQIFQYLVATYGGQAGPPPSPKPKK